MKKIVLLLLLITLTLFGRVVETDQRLNHYPEALKWLEDADTNGESAYNIGVLYRISIKDNDKAIEWYTKAYDMDDKGASIDATVNLAAVYIDLKQYDEAEKWYKKGITKGSAQASFGLGLLYKKLQRYDDAIFYYKKAISKGNIAALTALGYLYSVDYKQKEQGIYWYKKAAKLGDSDAIENLSYAYHDLNDDIIATAYVLATINYGFEKDDTFKYLKDEWKIDDDTIKQAYQLQKTLDIPKHYYDPELESELTKQRLDKHEKRDLR